jgi:predicted lipid-binding transport protein (Tim44 family)
MAGDPTFPEASDPYLNEVPEMSRRPVRFLAFFAAAAFALAPILAEAAAGGNRSMGSRGARTQQAAPPTQTTPNAARPVERSATAPAQAQRPVQGAQAPQQQSWLQRNPMMAGLLGGMLGAGLIGMLMGGGFNLGEGLAGFLGMALQIALFAGIAMLVLRFIRSRREAAARPAAAYAGGAPGTPDTDPASGPMARTPLAADSGPVAGTGTGGGSNPFAQQGGDEIGLTGADFDVFEKRLGEVQAAWTRGDVMALKRIATPEMVSYLNEDLAANSSRGVENRVEDVKLEQGDLSEAWQEGGTQYASVAMRWSARDYEVSLADGRVSAGERDARQEHTEVWTFMRSQGGEWILSAIQQV